MPNFLSILAAPEQSLQVVTPGPRRGAPQPHNPRAMFSFLRAKQVAVCSFRQGKHNERPSARASSSSRLPHVKQRNSAFNLLLLAHARRAFFTRQEAQSSRPDLSFSPPQVKQRPSLRRLSVSFFIHSVRPLACVFWRQHLQTRRFSAPKSKSEDSLTFPHTRHRFSSTAKVSKRALAGVEGPGAAELRAPTLVFQSVLPHTDHTRSLQPTKKRKWSSRAYEEPASTRARRGRLRKTGKSLQRMTLWNVPARTTNEMVGEDAVVDAA